MELQLDSCTLAILAGGEGSRMGKPKGELSVNGISILSHLLKQFHWPGPTLLVTAPGREHPPDWELFSREVVDPVAGEGPLRGVLTALEASETLFTLVTTVDMPEVGIGQLTWLAEALDEWDDALGILMERPGEAQRIEPFPSIFHRDAAGLIRSRLQAGLGSVQSLPNTEEVFLLQPPIGWPERIWTNLNRPEDLQAWLVR